MLNQVLQNLKNDLEKEMLIELSAETIAKNIYPYLEKIYKSSPQYLALRKQNDYKKQLDCIKRKKGAEK